MHASSDNGTWSSVLYRSCHWKLDIAFRPLLTTSLLCSCRASIFTATSVPMNRACMYMCPHVQHVIYASTSKKAVVLLPYSIRAHPLSPPPGLIHHTCIWLGVHTCVCVHLSPNTITDTSQSHVTQHSISSQHLHNAAIYDTAYIDDDAQTELASHPSPVTHSPAITLSPSPSPHSDPFTLFTSH